MASLGRGADGGVVGVPPPPSVAVAMVAAVGGRMVGGCRVLAEGALFGSESHGTGLPGLVLIDGTGEGVWDWSCGRWVRLGLVAGWAPSAFPVSALFQ